MRVSVLFALVWFVWFALFGGSNTGDTGGELADHVTKTIGVEFRSGQSSHRINK